MRSLPDEMMAVKPEGVQVPALWVQVPLEPAGLPPESHHEGPLEDLEFILQRNPPNPASSQQRFRQLHYEDAAGPRDVLTHLQKLARQWLRPDIHTKEQIVKMLVQEQIPGYPARGAQSSVQRCQSRVRITG